MVKRMHKPISDSEIVTIADNQRRLKVGSPQRLLLTDLAANVTDDAAELRA